MPSLCYFAFWRNWTKDDISTYVGGTVSLALVLAFVGLMFLVADGTLRKFGLTSSVVESGAVWLVVGWACSLYWPLRFRKELRGQWRGTALRTLFLPLAGPFAIILGMPL